MGDLPKPKLAFFFDEAHLLFKDASDALMEQIERTARLIRSKGVGVYFVTQAPTDVPSSVLSQLGNRVQHALRAFTPDDADALRKAARTFPMTDALRRRAARSPRWASARRWSRVLNAEGHPDAARGHAPGAARLADGAADARGDRRAGRGVAARGQVQHRGRPGVGPRDHQRPPDQREGRRPRPPPPRPTMRDQVSPTTADGLEAMTPAQQQREIERRARELEAARKAAERERKAREKEAAAMARERERTMRTTVNTVGKVLNSRGTQSILRGVFDTIFGGGKR